MKVEAVKVKMIQAYIDWYVDNPNDEVLMSKFFKEQEEYKRLKGEK